MASLRYWYTGQLVTSQEMRGGDAALEEGTRNVPVDFGLVGVLDGFGVVEHAGTPNLTVDVAAGLAYSPLGERIRMAGTSIVDCAFDYLGAPTAVTTPGNSRIVDVYAVFDRILSDPRIDATNTTIYFVQDESFAFEVRQGAEAISPAAPAAPADGVLVARITRTFGQTQILNADINTTVRADLLKLTGSPFSITAQSLEAGIQAFLTRYNQHVTGAADVHSGAAMTYGGSGAWVDGNVIPAGTVEAAIDTLVSQLAAVAAPSGASKLGGHAIVGVSSTIPAGSLYSQLEALKVAANLDVAARAGWLDSTTNPAATLQAALAKIITDLSSQSGSNDGGSKIGAGTSGGVPDTLSQGTVRSQLASLLTFVNARARIASAETITGNWTVSGAWSITGNHTRSGTLTRSGSSAWEARRYTDKGSPGANTTIDVAADIFGFGNPAGVPSTVAVTQPTGQPAGITIEVFTYDALANGYTFRDGAGGPILTTFAATATDRYGLTLMWDGANWKVIKKMQWTA